MSERPLADSFRRLIAATGPISLAQYMAESNAHYYASRDPLGAAGDFVTAPEISQMFGELVGLWLADLWLRAGSPAPVRYVELGPGRGTLAKDALRAMAHHGLEPEVHFVEGSEALKGLQLTAVPQARFHDDLASVPMDGPILLIANEFLDALTMRQLVRTAEGWREAMIAMREDAEFTLVPGNRPMDAAVPESRRSAEEGTVLETSPAAAAILFEVAGRLTRQGGAALFIDYGHAEPRTGSTLQAVRAHRKVDPLAAPGEADLTAHVDFAMLAGVAQSRDARWLGTVEQGAWLQALGIDARAQSLARSAPEQADAIMIARDRLVAPEQMGTLFKVMGLAAPNWPDGAGFPRMSQTHRISNRSIFVAALSTVVEWYDFTLYLYFATVLSRVFFGPGEAALLTTLGGFAVAYLMRPVGAVVFGHIADRHGRRPMLLLSMALMSLAMLATALLPTNAQIGATAGWLLFALRCVMGFSVGGEYTGVIAYLLEGARPDRRGLIASLAAAASEIGALLAVGVSALTVAWLSEAQLQTWGWRIPFFLGAALAGTVWLARSTMEESPDFERLRDAGTLAARPLAHALTHQRAGLLRAFAISALGSITYYVGITYVPAFLTSVGSMSESQALWLSTLAAVAVIVVTPLVGLLSDRFGRKPALIVLALLSAALPIAMFTTMAGASAEHALLGALVLAVVAGGVSAVGAIATGEQFSEESRATGLGLGYTLATAIFGGLTPYVAQLLVERTGAPQVPGLMIAVVALAALPVFVLMRETAPRAQPTEGR